MKYEDEAEVNQWSMMDAVKIVFFSKPILTYLFSFYQNNVKIN